MRIDIGLGTIAVNVGLCKSVPDTGFKRVRQIGFNTGGKAR